MLLDGLQRVPKVALEILKLDITRKPGKFRKLLRR